jgi:hypothetical protein
LVERTVTENLTLKHYLGSVITGLRGSAPDVAWMYTQSWITTGDPLLWRALVDSYRFVDWSNLHANEWEVLRQLEAKASKAVDHYLIWLTRQFTPYNAQFAVDLLKAIAARADEGRLRNIAMVLAMRDNAHTGWAMEFSNTQDFFDIVQTFERLPSLDDYHIQRCLDRLGQIDPICLIDFVEHRISSIAERPSVDSHCEVIPYDFSQALASIRSSPACPVVLRRVRNWTLRDNISFRRYAPHILKAVTSEIDTAIYDALMEWVESQNDQKMRRVADILHDFNMGDRFYALCREVVRRTSDEPTLTKLQSAIKSTPIEGVSVGLSDFSRRRLKEVSLWLHDEDFRVRLFAKRLTQSLQRDIEREQACEEFDRRSW